MGWRKKMGIEQKEINSKSYIQKVQNIQKVEKKDKKEAFAPFVPFALNNQKIKIPLRQLDSLWEKAPLLKHPEEIKLKQSQSCPARCKRTGKCYGIAYFDAKSGKAAHCLSGQCPWNDQSKQYSNTKEN